MRQLQKNIKHEETPMITVVVKYFGFSDKPAGCPFNRSYLRKTPEIF